MSKTTKEDILIVALHLFARDGYEAVSVSQIAGELGMTKGALYRHYESKRDIFEHIVKRMEQGDGEQAESHDMPADKKENEPEQYEEISADNFMEYPISNDEMSCLIEKEADAEMKQAYTEMLEGVLWNLTTEYGMQSGTWN